MTRKHFVLIAKALGISLHLAATKEEKAGVELTIAKIVAALKSDNPSFNEEKFLVTIAKEGRTSFVQELVGGLN
jgi:hypothetical protein